MEGRRLIVPFNGSILDSGICQKDKSICQCCYEQVISTRKKNLDAAFLLPGSSITVDMVARGVGLWGFGCDVQV